MSQTHYFGTPDKEPPALTQARHVLGVGRKASDRLVKRVYRTLAMRYHPDRYKGPLSPDEVKQRFGMCADAYDLLRDESRRDDAERQLARALNEPFVVGRRVFWLGSLYGIRRYMPYQDVRAITDPKRLLTSKAQPDLDDRPETEARSIGVRGSILEEPFADAFMIYWGGKRHDAPLPGCDESPEALFDHGFFRRTEGGMDDLPWIRANELAVFHFLNRNFDRSVEEMRRANRMVKENIVFLYRLGVCLEAQAAQPKYDRQRRARRKLQWEAILLYEKVCMPLLLKRKMPNEAGFDVPAPPESQLTVLMQLADAYAHMGPLWWGKARRIWRRVRRIDPECYEARAKGRRLPLATLVGSVRVAGLLTGGRGRGKRRRKK